jgi:hypothetical protein
MRPEEETIMLALRIVASDAVADLLGKRGVGDAISDDAADLYRARGGDMSGEPFALGSLIDPAELRDHEARSAYDGDGLSLAEAQAEARATIDAAREEER